MKTVQELNTAIAAKAADVQAKAAEIGEEPTAEQVAEIKSLNDAIEGLKGQRDMLETVTSAVQNATVVVKTINAAETVPVSGVTETKSSGHVEFTGTRDRDSDAFTGTRAEREAKSYGFAQWFLATQFGVPSAVKYCQRIGVEAKAQSEGTNLLGGALVPPQYSNDMIDLRERYGVFRRNAKNVQMTSDSLVVPRRAGGLTSYYVSEGASITDSSKNWNNVSLVAKELATLTYYSVALNEDAMISIGNDLASEIAYAFAYAEDLAGFIGDGTSTYGNIVGVNAALRAVHATIASIKGLQVASGNLFSEFTLADFNGLKALLPQYARMGDVKWYASQAFYSGVMEKLALAAGGVTAAEIVAGVNTPKFMGYNVEITQAMPATDSNSQIACLFGDLSSAALFGDRRSTTIAVDGSYRFANNQISIRGTQRYDINVHDVGNTTTAGPIVGLISAAA